MAEVLLPTNLYQTLVNFVKDQGFHKTYWLAYSGGLDSHALLDLLANLRAVHPLQLHAVHINHGLSPHAAAWADHCQKVCQELQVPCTVLNVDAQRQAGKSPEAIARHLRYQAFASLLKADDVLLTAHHQDDQAETLLLQLIRGAGLKGLAAMPALKSFAAGLHARPLLNFTRAQLQTYAEANQLNWINDESNSNTSLQRNFLRHEILPLLQQRWPTITTTLSRTATHCAEAQQLLNEFVTDDLAAVRGSVPGTLSVIGLINLDPSRQRSVLRAWFTEQGLVTPGTIKLRQVQQDMLHARADAAPCVSWDKTELRRYRDNLYARSLTGKSIVAPGSEQFWDFQQPLFLAEELGVLQAEHVLGQGLLKTLPAVTVRFRQLGERCELPGRTDSQALKKLLQEWSVPPWERARVPLLYVGNHLVAAVGYFIAPDYRTNAGEFGYRLQVSQREI